MGRAGVSYPPGSLVEAFSDYRWWAMQAYQFSTTVENGFIRIPDEYATKLRDRIKVIVYHDEPPDTDWTALFPPTVDTKAWKFNREEANER